MREEIENLINEELDKISPSLEEVYEPIEEEINENIDLQNEIAKETGMALPEEQEEEKEAE